MQILFSSAKHVDYLGSPSDSDNGTGSFSSPGFPQSYALRDEIYTYLVHNTQPGGLIRLGFPDWSLSPNSRITVSTQRSLGVCKGYCKCAEVTECTKATIS